MRDNNRVAGSWSSGPRRNQTAGRPRSASALRRLSASKYPGGVENKVIWPSAAWSITGRQKLKAEAFGAADFAASNISRSFSKRNSRLIRVLLRSIECALNQNGKTHIKGVIIINPKNLALELLHRRNNRVLGECRGGDLM
jgi:hypothetical protein